MRKSTGNNVEKAQLMDFQELQKYLGVGRQAAAEFGRRCRRCDVGIKRFYLRSSVEAELEKALAEGRLV